MDASETKIAHAAASVMQDQLQRIAELEADCRQLRSEHRGLATAVVEYFATAAGQRSQGWQVVRAAREALEANARAALVNRAADSHTGSDRNSRSGEQLDVNTEEVRDELEKEGCEAIRQE
jgi:hypothetical protein